MSPLPNAASASARACCTAAFNARSFNATRIPRPPPPAEALINTGKPISMGKRHGFGFALDQPLAAGHRGHVCLVGQSPGGVLVAQQGHGLGRGTDEADVATAADFGEMGVFGQKAVTGVDRLNVADLGRADHPIDLQIAVRRLGRADAKHLVGQFQVGGAAVRLAEDAHRFDAQLATGAEDPQSDFTTVGNQNTLEHLFHHG